MVSCVLPHLLYALRPASTVLLPPLSTLTVSIDSTNGPPQRQRQPLPAHLRR